MKIPVDLAITALDQDDAMAARRWRNDMRVMRWCRQREVISDVEQQAWYNRQTQDPTIQMYSVRLKTGAAAETVGVAGLTSLDWFNRRAEFSLYIDPAKQRQGLGRAALQLLLAHAFVNLGLEQVYGEVLDGNPALQLFAQLGFQADGKRRGWYYKDGKRHDAHLISMTREEYHGHRARPAPADGGGQPGRNTSAAKAADRAAGRSGKGRPRRRGIAAVLSGDGAGSDRAQDAGVSPGGRGGSEAGAQGAGADA